MKNLNLNRLSIVLINILILNYIITSISAQNNLEKKINIMYFNMILMNNLLQMKFLKN